MLFLFDKIRSKTIHMKSNKRTWDANLTYREMTHPDVTSTDKYVHIYAQHMRGLISLSTERELDENPIPWRFPWERQARRILLLCWVGMF